MSYGGVNKDIVVVWIICSIIYIMMGVVALNLFGLLGEVISMMLILEFILLREDLKLRVFDVFIKVMSVLLVCSITEFLIYQFTGFRYVLFDNLIYLEQVPMVQTLFNIMHPESPYGILGLANFFRFQSLADEPGGLGTIMGFLLFATVGNPKYKRQYIIFWIAGMLSFSLAFYVIAFAHLIVSFRNKGSKGFLLLFVVVAIVGYSLFRDVFDYMIVGRVSGNEISEVDNRTSDFLDKELIKAFKDGSILFGHKVIEGESAAGVKGVLYYRGLIGMLALILGFSYVFIKKTKSLKLVDNSSFALMFLIVFWMSYYQRSYIWMFQYVIPFFCLPIMLKYKESIINK